MARYTSVTTIATELTVSATAEILSSFIARPFQLFRLWLLGMPRFLLTSASSTLNGS